MRESKEASIDVTNVEDLHHSKTSQSTTLTQLLLQTEGLLPGESMFSDSLPQQMDGKSCVTLVTTLKQDTKMHDEKKQGKKFDDGKPAMELLSTKALIEIARVMGYGKDKYGAQNWRAGLNWSRLIGAAFRHLSAFNDGEDLDPETGLSHIAHLSCCAMFLLEYIKTHSELDDRYKGEKS